MAICQRNSCIHVLISTNCCMHWLKLHNEGRARSSLSRPVDPESIGRAKSDSRQSPAWEEPTEAGYSGAESSEHAQFSRATHWVVHDPMHSQNVGLVTTEVCTTETLLKTTGQSAKGSQGVGARCELPEDATTAAWWCEPLDSRADSNSKCIGSKRPRMTIESRKAESSEKLVCQFRDVAEGRSGRSVLVSALLLACQSMTWCGPLDRQPLGTATRLAGKEVG
jgi:hypothetical protein